MKPRTLSALIRFWRTAIAGTLDPIHREKTVRLMQWMAWGPASELHVVRVMETLGVFSQDVIETSRPYWVMDATSHPARFEKFTNGQVETLVRSILPYDGWGRGFSPLPQEARADYSEAIPEAGE